jgi:hypothetical protein
LKRSFQKMMGKKRKDEIKNCSFWISEGPVTSCTVNFEIRKVQWEIWAGKGPENTLLKIELDFTVMKWSWVMGRAGQKRYWWI